MNEDRICQESEPQTGMGQPIEEKCPRDVNIHKVMNGFQVRVGCKNLVFENKDEMIAELSRYYDNPRDVEKEYLEKYK